MNEQNGRQRAAPHAPPAVVAQATLRPRSELECERLIRLAHRRGIASATAYRGAYDDGASIFLMLLDEREAMEGFLPELREAAPEAHVSMIREEAVHDSPADFLRGGVLKRGAFRAEARHAAWVFAGAPSGSAARRGRGLQPFALPRRLPLQDDGGERRRVLRHSDLHERLWGIGASSMSIPFARNW